MQHSTQAVSRHQIFCICIPCQRLSTYLYGMWPLLLSTSALMTLPRAVRDRLILMPSFSWSPAHRPAHTSTPRAQSGIASAMLSGSPTCPPSCWHCAAERHQRMRLQSVASWRAVGATCCACLALALAPSQVHQVELANTDVRRFGSCSCRSRACHTAQQPTNSTGCQPRRHPANAQNCAAQHAQQSRARYCLPFSRLQRHTLVCGVEAVCGLNGDCEDGVRAGAVLVHQGGTHDTALFAYLQRDSNAHIRVASCADPCANTPHTA